MTLDIMRTLSPEEIVAQLWDRQQINDVMLRFGRGLDLHDWDLYASTLDDPSDVDFFDLPGRPPTSTTPQLFADFARRPMHESTSHTANLRRRTLEGGCFCCGSCGNSL